MNESEWMKVSDWKWVNESEWMKVNEWKWVSESEWIKVSVWKWGNEKGWLNKYVLMKKCQKMVEREWINECESTN